MIVTANRLRSIGWIALLLLCGVVLMVMAFRVNALRSQVHRAELRIVALKQEKMYLETEFETRANQQQLKAWNDVEFGYVAPTAGQYLENERQLASLSMPAAPDAPQPIRVASVDDAVVAQAAFPAMVSPLTGKPLGEGRTADAAEVKPSAAATAPARVDHAAATAALGQKLATVRREGENAAAAPAKVAPKAGPKGSDKLATKDVAKPAAAAAAKAPVKGVVRLASAVAKGDARKSVEKPLARSSAGQAAKPKAAKVKTAGSADSRATRSVRLAMKDEKTKK